MVRGLLPLRCSVKVARPGLREQVGSFVAAGLRRVNAVGRRYGSEDGPLTWEKDERCTNELPPKEATHA